MATKSTKTAKRNTTVKTSQVEDITVNNKVEENKPIKKRINLHDGVEVTVKSNVFGELNYINHKTGTHVKWEKYGEPQTLSMADLREMKGSQISFFKENWIILVSVNDEYEDFNDIDIKEVYKNLDITRYYKNIFEIDDINTIFNWSIKDIKEKVPNMSKSMKENIIIRANELIELGVLDSLSKIKALQEVLDCELTTITDNIGKE